jgi:Mg/Co/Ni transporter MgtE
MAVAGETKEFLATEPVPTELSTGAIIGIVVGTIFGAILVVVLIALFVKSRYVDIVEEKV